MNIIFRSCQQILLKSHTAPLNDVGVEGKLCSQVHRKQVRLNHRLTFRALPGGPHVLHADVQVGSVEAAVFGFGVMILQILPEKLRRRRRRRRSLCELQPCLVGSGGEQTGFSSHLVRLGHVHRPVCVVVHLFVDAADRLETQQGVFILTELLVYHTQIYNTERRRQQQQQHIIITFTVVHRGGRCGITATCTP